MSHRIRNAAGALLQMLTPIRVVVICAVGAFFWFVIMGDQGLYRLERLLHMKNRLLLERKTLNDEIDRLTREKALLADPANLETAIRRELGSIKPGEVIFEDHLAPAAPQPATEPAAPPPPPAAAQ